MGYYEFAICLVVMSKRSVRPIFNLSLLVCIVERTFASLEELVNKFWQVLLEVMFQSGFKSFKSQSHQLHCKLLLVYQLLVILKPLVFLQATKYGRRHSALFVNLCERLSILPTFFASIYKRTQFIYTNTTYISTTANIHIYNKEKRTPSITVRQIKIS